MAYMCTKFETVASVISELWLGAQKFKIGHVTICPIWGTVSHPKTNTSYGQPVYKIWSLALAIPEIF